VVGTVTLIYDHPIRVLPEKITELQPEHHHLTTSTMPIWITMLVSKRWCGV
jgi:metal-responsive CopG/Arc/MetJ family transcriptional regulator